MVKRRRETSHSGDCFTETLRHQPCLDPHALGPRSLELEATSDLPETSGRFQGKPWTSAEERGAWFGLMGRSATR